MAIINYLISCCIFILTLLFNVAAHAAPEADWQYVVIKNDSFERIYQKFLSQRANILELSNYNQHALVKKLQPGQVMNIPIVMLKKIPVAALVIAANGNVNVVEVADSISRKLNQGEALNTGAVIETAKNSLAKLRFEDGSSVDIQPNSTLTIQSSFKYAGKASYVTQVKLKQGRTTVLANPAHIVGNKLQVETPSAVAAVRGTAFRLSVNGDTTIQETLEGQVAFTAAGNEVLLSKGYGSVAEKDKAPLASMALLLAPDVSGFATYIERLPVEFTIVQQEGAVAWFSQLARDADFEQIVSEQLIASDSTGLPSQLSFNGLSNGQYYLRIRGQKSNGLQGLDATHTFTFAVNPVAHTFELISPENGAMIPVASTIMKWTQVPDATSYLVQIARDADFTQPLFEFVTTDNQVASNYAFASGEYHWQVIALSNNMPLKVTTSRKFLRR